MKKKNEKTELWAKGSRKRIVQDRKTGFWRLYQNRTSFLYRSIRILGPSRLIAKTGAPFTPRVETHDAIECFPAGGAKKRGRATLS